MKKIFLILLLMTCIPCNSQTQGNYPIPDFFIGKWTNITGTDTIEITAQSIIWTSNENFTLVSFVDYIYYQNAIFFSFSGYPNDYKLSLEKVSRVKIIFNAQTPEGYNRRNDTYIKQGTRLN